MGSQWIAIITGLVSSILTIVLTKFIEIIQKKNEFKYELKKVFFNKKLLAAEAVVSQSSILSIALHQLMILYSRYSEADSAIGEELTDNLQKQINDKLALANSSSFDLANSIALYFDFESEVAHNEILSSFYDELNLLSPYFENVEVTHQQFLKFYDTSQKQEAYELYLASEKNLGDAMTKVSLTYKKFDLELKKIIQYIRKEMKRYE